MFRSKKFDVTLAIARAALESIFDECDRYNADETGGRLLGTYRKDRSGYDITVSGVIEPGPGARRTSTSFFQDGEYQERVFRAIEAKHKDVEHLGNWHTHHVNGYPTLSGGDVTTYNNIVNHENHNTDFFYALLVVKKNHRGNPRYDVRHYILRRNDKNVYEVPLTDVHIIDIPLLSATEEAVAPKRVAQIAGRGGPLPNPERAKDKDFFEEFYPELRSLFSEKIGAPYWKGPLTLVDGSQLDLVAVESTDGRSEYSIVTAGDHPTCAEPLASYKGRKFASARQAIIHLERDLNRELYQTRK
jgi:integrative and conjugative element protein (TIGR02256 family)